MNKFTLILLMGLPGLVCAQSPNPGGASGSSAITTSDGQDSTGTPT